MKRSDTINGEEELTSLNARASTFAAVATAIIFMSVLNRVSAGNDAIYYSRVPFQHVHRPDLGQPVNKKGKMILLDGSEYTVPNLDEFGQWRYAWVRDRLRFRPGGMDAGTEGDMACFVLERRHSLMNPGGAMTVYFRAPKAPRGGTPLTIELDFQGAALKTEDGSKTTFINSITNLGVFVDGVQYKRFTDGRGETWGLRRGFVGLALDRSKSIGGLHKLTLADLSEPEENRQINPGTGWGLIDSIRIGAGTELEVVAITNNYDLAEADVRPVVSPEDYQKETRLQLRDARHHQDAVELLPAFKYRGVYVGYNPLDRAFYHSFMDRDYPGSLHAYFENTSDKPVHIADVRIAGVPLIEARHRGMIAWHRIWPNPVQPGQVTQMTTRLYTRPNGPGEVPVQLQLITEDGHLLEATLVMEEAKPGIDYIAFEADLKQMHVYVSLLPGESIKQVFVEARDATSYTDIHYAGRDESRTAYLDVNLPEPWGRGEPLTFEVHTTHGRHAAAQTRAFESIFGLGVFGNINKALDNAEEMSLNLHWATSGNSPNEEHVRRAEAKGVGLITGENEALKNSPARFGMYLTDEIEWHDNVCGALSGYLGQWEENRRVRRFMDEYRHIRITPMGAENISPFGFYAWGQFPTIYSTDRYLIKNKFENIDILYETALAARLASVPRQSHVALQAYKGHRLPTADENRHMSYSVVAAGSKGLTYWAYKHYAAITDDAEQWTSVAKVHREIATIGKQMAISHPVDMVDQARPEGLFVKTLLSTKRGVAVVVLNRNHTHPPVEELVKVDKTGDEWQFHTVHDGTVGLALPDWLVPQSAMLIDNGQMRPVKMTSRQGDTRLQLEPVEVAQLIWIKNRNN